MVKPDNGKFLNIIQLVPKVTGHSFFFAKTFSGVRVNIQIEAHDVNSQLICINGFNISTSVP